jgi:hypothetical protein
MNPLNQSPIHINPVAAALAALLFAFTGCVPASSIEKASGTSAPMAETSATPTDAAPLSSPEAVATPPTAAPEVAPAPAVEQETVPQEVAEPEETSVATAPPVAIPAPAPAPQAQPVPMPKPRPAEAQIAKTGDYRMPLFDANWGLTKSIYEKTAKYYDNHYQEFKNSRYVTIVDFTKKSTEKRFFIFDLKTNKVVKLHTTHGKNSDKDGFAVSFSNKKDSLQSSLGFYRTGNHYIGEHGYSLRLSGLSPTNSNAEERAIVIHSADYVSESKGYAGLSWGCLALDKQYNRSVIDHLAEGSLLYVSK